MMFTLTILPDGHAILTTEEDMAALFDTHDHATVEGWATYHKHLGWRALGCRIVGHRLPPKPSPANGYAPSNYARCSRCRSWIKWFVDGQHRWGSLSRSCDSTLAKP